MKSIYQFITAAIILSHAHAATTITLPGSQEDGAWTNLNSTSYTSAAGYPTSFSNTSVSWPQPINPNVGIISAQFNKIAGSGGYFSSAGYVYNFGLIGSYTVGDLSPIALVKTIIFQAEMSQAAGIAPTISYNGGTQNIAADYFNQSPGGTYTNYAYQWDLTALPAITDYTINWSTGEHTAIKRLDLTAGNTFQQVIPEPSCFLLGLASCSLLLIRRRS